MKLICSLALLSIIISSCSHVRHEALPEANKTAKSPETAGIENRKKERSVVLRRRIAALIHEKNYEKALDLIDVALKLGGSEQKYSQECVDSINGLTEAGISSLSFEDYESAGMTFRKILDHYPSDRNIRSEIDYSVEQLVSLMKTCEDKLMEGGLSEYRQGNLGNAILLWNKILSFNKEHAKAKKMIATTSTQLRNLETIK